MQEPNQPAEESEAALDKRADQKRNAFFLRYGRQMTAAELTQSMGKKRMGMSTSVQSNERRRAIKEIMQREGLTKKQVIKRLKVVRRDYNEHKGTLTGRLLTDSSHNSNTPEESNDA